MNILSQKEQIQQAALNVFSKKGYSGTTMFEIASHAGVNPATIYRFFSGKQGLFQSLQRPDLDFPDQQEQQLRDGIMRSALMVFSQKGYAAATMDDIAEAVDLSKAGIYSYFPSKEKLFYAVLENPVGFVLVNFSLNAFLSHEDADLEEGLVNLAKTYLSLFEKEEFVSLFKIILSEGVRNPDIALGFKEKIVKPGSEIVARYLQKFCDLEPTILVMKIQSLFGMLFSWGILNYLLVQKNEPQQFDLDRVAREYVHQFLYGIRDSIDKKSNLEVV